MELLIASVISVVVIGLLMAVLNYASGVWVRSRSHHQAFQSASTAFETLTRQLSQAVLNTYWSYDNPALPQNYLRASELHFVLGPTRSLFSVGTAYPGSAVFFQAPLGRTEPGRPSRLTARLNAVGFFTAFGGDPKRPAVLATRVPARWRYRLYEWTEPTDALQVYTSLGEGWLAAALDETMERSRHVSILAENVIAIFLVAEYPLADGTWSSHYVYDSRDEAEPVTLHQLPPRLQVALVAIDEPSATRLASLYQEEPPLPLPADRFHAGAALNDDLAAWEADLQSRSPAIQVRSFRATIQIPNARWSAP